MSGLDRWLDEARNKWGALRVQFTRLAPTPITADQLASEDAVTRWRAVHALVDRPRADLLPQLIALMRDEDVMVRAAAVDALVSWGPTIVLEPVRQALAQSPSSETAIALLEVLARLPDPMNRAAIQIWFDHENEAVRAAAFMALSALCNDADLSLLGRALKEDGLLVQRAIMATLCAPNASSLAQCAADSTDSVLRQRGRQALARIQRNQPSQTDKNEKCR